MLKAEGLSVNYGNLEVIHQVNFQVRAGQVTVIVGSNGAGKSTMLRAVTGFGQVRAGTVVFNDQDITRQPPYRIVEAGVSLVDEGVKIFPYMTVMENLLLGAYKKQAWGRKERNLRSVFELFPRLAERKGQQARTLSGGERRMLGIGRGLMAEPRLLMLDEPSSGLAPVVVMNVFNAIKSIAAQGITILLVEQNVWESLSLGNFGYVIENGSLVLKGECQDLLHNPRIKQAYLHV